MVPLKGKKEPVSPKLAHFHKDYLNQDVRKLKSQEMARNLLFPACECS